MADRKATNVWQGDLPNGSGEVTLDSSGAAGPLPVTFPARSGEPEGMTSPEELIGAAHASCFNMVLAKLVAAKADAPAERLETSAVVTFSTEGGAHIAKIALHVRGRASGISNEDFVAAAEGAKAGCPVSKLIGDTTEVTLDAALE